jgi:ATP-binding protein involved in chromosome partitioning
MIIASTQHGKVMQILTDEEIRSALQQVVDDNLEQDLVTANAVKAIEQTSDTVSISIELGYPSLGYVEQLRQKIEAVISPRVHKFINVDVYTNILSHSVQKSVKPLAGVKNTIAVASGKGGVGKSTTAVNLALALQAEGATVGILDADIYGPSQPRMLGCYQKPDSKDGKRLEPNVSYGLQSMSIGYLIDEETPMIWRGPMVTSALEQLLGDTNWIDLDYLIIDLPPGTGDIQLTLCQKIPVSGAIIVTTPQDIALLDARKALRMFEKVEVSVLGIVENMSTHICSECGHEEHIFGEGGGSAMANQYNVTLLGDLPLDRAIREGVDVGKPTVAVSPDSSISESYRAIARKASAILSRKAKDYSGKFPKIVVENT